MDITYQYMFTMESDSAQWFVPLLRKRKVLGSSPTMDKNVLFCKILAFFAYPTDRLSQCKWNQLWQSSSQCPVSAIELHVFVGSLELKRSYIVDTRSYQSILSSHFTNIRWYTKTLSSDEAFNQIIVIEPDLYWIVMVPLSIFYDVTC